MIGNNDFFLNEATVCEAVEYWLNNSQLSLSVPVKVKSVDQRNEGYVKIFAVSVEPKSAASDSL